MVSLLPARPELDIAGIAETALSPVFAARLPNGIPAAPWTCEAEAILWFDRAGRAAAHVLPALVRRRAGPVGVVGAIVRHHRSPVGAHDVVAGAVVYRRGSRLRTHLGFLAANSEASLTAGRANWGVPATLGAFAGTSTCGTVTAIDAAVGAPSWTVGVTTREAGPRLPLYLATTVEQQFPGDMLGTAVLRMRCLARPARVITTVDSDGELAAWLGSGRRTALRLSHLRYTVTPSRLDYRQPIPGAADIGRESEPAARQSASWSP
ncbi:hypothetical protein [Nocardia brasiliensis]|uniref:hypothetical protein n=1 Tax=Nocardia brasiliensis TaxID=37326 RepID=UPI0004A6D6A4|nr:hypothetical protein [Nocardia brasiliensis]